MTGKKVLISGASIAGPTLAFWLARFGFEATIVERAASLRLGGQNIDISGAAQTIAQLMGIEDEIRAANTGEMGVRFVDENNETKAELPKGESNLGTRELEILRGDLVEILYRHTKDDVEYLFGNQITALAEEKDGVTVTGRGMKTLQLVRTDAGWRISAAAWDDEREGLDLSSAAVH